MKITTKIGDEGMTNLLGGRRVSKSCTFVELIGQLDELQSILGWCKVSVSEKSTHEALEKIQEDLYKMMCFFANGSKYLGGVEFLGEADLRFLEEGIEGRQKSIENLHGFVRPGNTEVEARMGIARTVCRRVEREFVRASEETPEIVTKYLNRLSDFLFVLGQEAEIC